MVEEKEGRHFKTDKELRDAIWSSIKITKDRLAKFEEYRIRHKIKKTKPEVLAEIIDYFLKTDMPISVLTDKFDNYQIKKTLDEKLDSIDKKLAGFTEEHLKETRTFKDDVKSFLIEAIKALTSNKPNDSIVNEKIYILLDALTKGLLDDTPENQALLARTLHAIKELEKTNDIPLTKENKNLTVLKKLQSQGENVAYIQIEGKVWLQPRIDKFDNGNQLMFCSLKLGEKKSDSQSMVWHTVYILESELTESLGLSDQESIKIYFAKIKKDDTLKLKGFFKDVESTNGEGKKSVLTSFITTEILEHKPFVITAYKY